MIKDDMRVLSDEGGLMRERRSEREMKLTKGRRKNKKERSIDMNAKEERGIERRL